MCGTELILYLQTTEGIRCAFDEDEFLTKGFSKENVLWFEIRSQGRIGPSTNSRIIYDNGDTSKTSAIIKTFVGKDERGYRNQKVHYLNLKDGNLSVSNVRSLEIGYKKSM